MKILLFTSHLNAGGIASYLLTLTQGLIHEGHDIVIVAQAGDCEKRFAALGAKVIQLPIRVKSELHPRLWWYLPQLCTVIRREKIDVIHAQTRVTQVMGTWASWFTRKTLITTCHGFFKPRWHRRWFGCWGKIVIAISRPVRDHLINDLRVLPSKVMLITNGVDLDRFMAVTPQMKVHAKSLLGIGDAPLIGIIARLSSVKGVDILIDAFARVKNTIPDAMLVIVGDGPEEQRLRQQVDQLGLSGWVQFQHGVDDTATIIPAFDVVAAPSRMEGLGLSVMEAMAMGKPVVASRVGGLIDLIDDGVNGYLITPEHSILLADHLIAILQNPKGAAVIGRKAREQMVMYFNANKMVHQTRQSYEQYSRC